MSTYKCSGKNCGQAFPSQRSLTGHMIRCPKYMNGVKNQLREYKNAARLENERSAQLPPLQEGASRLSGNVEDVAPIAEAGVDDMEQVDSVRVLILHVVYVTDVIKLQVRDATPTRVPSIWSATPQDTAACSLSRCPTPSCSNNHSANLCRVARSSWL